MRKLTLFTMAAITVITASSCSKLSESLTVKVPVEASIDLDVPAGGGDLKSSDGNIFFASASYNTGTDPTVLKYKDKIKSIAADGGKIKIVLPSPITSVTLTETTLQIRDVDTGVLVASWTFEAKTYENNAEFTLGAPQGGSFESFSDALDRGANLMIELSGDSGDMNEAFKLNFLIQMAVNTKILG